MTWLRRLLNRMAFSFVETPFNIYLASDERRLIREFRKLLDGSKQYFYFCQTSGRPLFSGAQVGDYLIGRLAANAGRPLDIKVLVIEEFAKGLSYVDSSFRMTRKSIGDFIVSDAGTVVISTREGVLFNLRPADPGENLKERFLAAYQASTEAG